MSRGHDGVCGQLGVSRLATELADQTLLAQLPATLSHLKHLRDSSGLSVALGLAAVFVSSPEAEILANTALRPITLVNFGVSSLHSLHVPPHIPNFFHGS